MFRRSIAVLATGAVVLTSLTPASWASPSPRVQRGVAAASAVPAQAMAGVDATLVGRMRRSALAEALADLQAATDAAAARLARNRLERLLSPLAP